MTARCVAAIQMEVIVAVIAKILLSDLYIFRRNAYIFHQWSGIKQLLVFIWGIEKVLNSLGHENFFCAVARPA